MSLLTDWREFAYSHDDRTREGQEFWIGYFNQEKAVYDKLALIVTDEQHRFGVRQREQLTMKSNGGEPHVLVTV